MLVQIYRTKIKKLPGTHWYQVIEKAFGQYKKIKHKTKRRPYIRSAYFKKEKIFLELFWNHLYEKTNLRDKTRRLKFFPCAIDLIENDKYEPTSKENPNRRDEILHRFIGSTPNDEVFFVQIKEEKKSGQKWLVSIFPLNK